jgi:hypothetical protein
MQSIPSTQRAAVEEFANRLKPKSNGDEQNRLRRSIQAEVRPARVAPGRPVGWHTRNMSVRSKLNPFYTVSGAEVVRLDCRMPRRDRNPGGAWVYRVYWYVWDLIIYHLIPVGWEWSGW